MCRKRERVQKVFKNSKKKFQNATVMPVPSAYNDLGTGSELRDHIGWVWYEKKEFVPLRDRNMRHVLRFGSVNYFAVVVWQRGCTNLKKILIFQYINSEKVTSHIGGHLPFEVDISAQIKFGAENKFTVAVNNTLSWSTIPQGDFNYQSVAPRNISGRIVSYLPYLAIQYFPCLLLQYRTCLSL